MVARAHGIVTARTHFCIMRTVKTSRPHGSPAASSTGRSYLIGPDAMSDKRTSHAPIGDGRRGASRTWARLALYSNEAPALQRGEAGSSSPGGVSKHTGRRATASRAEESPNAGSATGTPESEDDRAARHSPPPGVPKSRLPSELSARLGAEASLGPPGAAGEGAGRGACGGTPHHTATRGGPDSGGGGRSLRAF
eukprot:scaffold3114_cov114-Isochrysis_galbana.AAC.17